jgi:hypothetical protein
MGATYTRQSASAIVDGAVIEASDLNAEFDQILAAFAVTSGHTHDGTAAEGGPITKLLGTAITIGDATAGTDITVTFDGETADGVLTWMEDEDYFKFSDDILMNSTERLNFGDTGTYIFQSTDGQLDIIADTEVQIAATTIDINGAVDISGALTLAGVTLAETISDTVGAMVTSNTESGITVTYDDADNTLDFTVGTLNQNTTGNAATATILETARTIGGTSFDGSANIAVALSDTTTALATARTIGGTSFDGTANIEVALSATATALATARTIHGVSFDGTANIDLSEVISDTVGAMVTSNTESGITVTYDDVDNTLDFTVGTLNQNTTGNAATATALETARTIGGTSFDGTANIAVGLAATATALETARTIGGTSFDGTANIAVGLATTATTLATARTIAGQSFDGSANITIASTDLSNTSNITLNDGTQTLTNKTLTAPKIGTSILDTNGNELFLLTATASAVNEFTITNNTTGNNPILSATGNDTNIGVSIQPKGTGTVTIDALTFPASDGTADQVLTTNGSGVLSFVDNTGGTDWQTVKTSGFTAVAGEGYFCNTTSAAFTLTLPAGTLGDEISFIDYAGTFDTNALTVAPNGAEKIQGTAASLTISIERAANTLVYTDGTQGWLLKAK